MRNDQHSSVCTDELVQSVARLRVGNSREYEIDRMMSKCLVIVGQ